MTEHERAELRALADRIDGLAGEVLLQARALWDAGHEKQARITYSAFSDLARAAAAARGDKFPWESGAA